MHAVAQAWEAGKLFHIDLNDQMPGRFDQDLRFGSVESEVGILAGEISRKTLATTAPRHFDAHAYRTEDYEGVKDFARGCMRTYLILKEKAKRWNDDKEIQAILAEISRIDNGTPRLGALLETDRFQLLATVLIKT